MSAGVLSLSSEIGAISRERECLSEPNDSPRKLVGGRILRTRGLQLPLLAKFIAKNLGLHARATEQSSPDASGPQHDGSSSAASAAGARVGQGLKNLDLRSLPRDDGPPTELQARREKFAYYEKQCSEVAKGICVGGELVARDKSILQGSGITHIVNCIGMLCPECFPDDFKYLTLYLNDATGEDMVSLFYDVFAFIEEALSSGGKVLVHCSQGVSRSATFVIAYLMWKHDQPYDRTYQAVKAMRGVANPNIGFTCQLLNWAKRRSESGIKAFAIVPHSANEKFPPRLVARPLSGEPSRHQLESDKVLLLRTPAHTFIWQGSRSLPAHVEAAHNVAEGWRRFEGAPASLSVAEGCESPEFLAAVGGSQAVESSDAAQLRPKVPQVRLPLGWRTAGSGAECAPDSARSCKTPRPEEPQGPLTQRSPNQRQRKVRRSDSNSEGPTTARSRSSESLDEGYETALASPLATSPHMKTPQGRAARSPRVQQLSPMGASPRHRRQR